MAKLFMLLIGCRPPGRFTEQHDVFFGIGKSIKELLPQVKKFWPEVKGNLHIDAWREVTVVNGYNITVVDSGKETETNKKLFFINLGGYKKSEFEEFHYKMIVVAEQKGEAITMSKKTAFYKHAGFAGATSHIDDKYGIDVDDVFEINDILGVETKQLFHLKITYATTPFFEDELHIGYYKITSFK